MTIYQAYRLQEYPTRSPKWERSTTKQKPKIKIMMTENQLSIFASVAPEPAPILELRDYQKQVIRALYVAIKSGKRRLLLYAPTGAGKTAIASKIINDALSRERRVLFLIHRDPLLEQTQKALAVYGIETGIIKAGHKEDRSHPVQIASIQSLARRQFPEGIGLVIVDECHTTAYYDAFQRIKEYYLDAIFVGLTASPWRTKSATEYMGQHFDTIVQAPNPSQLITMGYLSPPRYFGFGGLVDLAKIDNGVDGDFNPKQLERAYMGAGVNERIVEEYVKLCTDRTAIAFAAGVEQSKLLTKLFNEAGISCEHLEAKTPHDERKGMYKRLASGQTRILSSVGTLTEGFDVPSISAIILARATKSKALLFQMCGRGLRLYPDKKDCFMLDFGENFKRLKYITSPQKITLEPTPKPVGEAPTKECPECNADLYAFVMVCPNCGYEFPSGDDGSSDFEAFDIEFGEMFPPELWGKVMYLRSQIRMRFTKRLPIDRVWKTFKAKFGYYPPNEWHLGAKFGTCRTETNRQLWLDYLNEINPNAPESWIKFHIDLEFGKPGQRYESRKGSYLPPLNQHKRREWWTVLGVTPLAGWEDIKAAYHQLAEKYNPDFTELDESDARERIRLVNWAFQQAMKIKPDLAAETAHTEESGCPAEAELVDENPSIKPGSVVEWSRCPGNLEWLQPFVVVSINDGLAQLEYLAEPVPVNQLNVDNS